MEGTEAGPPNGPDAMGAADQLVGLRCGEVAKGNGPAVVLFVDGDDCQAPVQPRLVVVRDLRDEFIGRLVWGITERSLGCRITHVGRRLAGRPQPAGRSPRRGRFPFCFAYSLGFRFALACCQVSHSSAVATRRMATSI